MMLSNDKVIPMKKFEIAKIFTKMADLLELQGVQWKPRAYRRAARSLESLQENIEDIWKRGELKEIPGIGDALAKKIEEYIQTGKIGTYEKLKKTIPDQITELMKIPGMGPKKAKRLYEELGVTTIKQLEKAAKQHKIAQLTGFGPESEENILKGILLLKSTKSRYLIGDIWPLANGIVDKLRKNQYVTRVQYAGSLRRMRETIGDIDILATSPKPNKVMTYFTSLPEVMEVLAKGSTKSSVILHTGVQVDLRIVKSESWGAALQYFTGSKQHNIHLRSIAIKKGYKLNEYGLFRDEESIAGKGEVEIYNKLGLDFIPPELREDTGEITAAMENKLPSLVDYQDIKGDLHIHSTWSDGKNTIKEIAIKAKSLGYEYVCITDHSKRLKIAHGLDENRLTQQIEEINLLNKEIEGIRILKGCEVDILADGSLDIDNSILKQLDVVTASIHSVFKMNRKEMTERITTALSNKFVNVLAHPTGRMIGKRPSYEVNLGELFTAAKKNNVHLEVNSFPDRLDLNDKLVREALKSKVKFSIATDAHNLSHFEYIRFGVAQARRGWAKPEDIINTHNLQTILKLL